MKTQISRDGYRRDKRYSGVYQQQGRLITDSDWNELVDTIKTRVDDALVDVIGTGSPKTGAAGIVMSGTTPKITPGTVYAGGVEARVVPLPGVSSPFNFTQQADFPASPPLPAAGTAYRIYADVWDRPVGALEDDGLRDPALHGADTCTRTQIMAQVKWSPVGKNPENPADNPGQGDARLTIKYPSGGSQTTADACDPKAQEVDPVGGDFLFRVEIHDARWPANAAPSAPDRVVVKWSRENGAEQYAFADIPDWFKTGPWTYELYDVDSERHLGFHLANTSWTPKRGSLTSTLPSTAPAGTMVRRWEGYLVLVRSGSAWAVSTANGEKAENTASGASVQFADGVMTVALADLEFSLEVVNRTFLPGDFWSAPVRRATYQAGKELLRNALPSGIVHRYVTLAEVLTTNQLKTRTAQEQRKLAFPRLTELDAGDMGYSTTCTSGLFDSTQDTVKKALDRLCSIGAVHVGYAKPSDNSVYKGNTIATVKDALDLLASVTSDDIGYTTTCTSGLFNNTHDTVEKALNRLCAINATHVGFTKPADTSVFQGTNPTTVAQAMGLLADVRSQQISYTPASNPAVHDVKAALDELYARPVQNGTRAYVGVNGQYATIELAIADLLTKGKDIVIALMPGEHEIPVGYNPPAALNGTNLNILGLGESTRINFRAPIVFLSLASFTLENVAAEFFDTRLTLTNCRRVVIRGCRIGGSRAQTNPSNFGLIGISGAESVMIQSSFIDTTWRIQDQNLLNTLGPAAALGNLVNVQTLFGSSLQVYRDMVGTLVNTISTMPASSRAAIRAAILATNPQNLTNEENVAYTNLANMINAGVVVPANLTAMFDAVRTMVLRRDPATAIELTDAGAVTTIENNRIIGYIGLHGTPHPTSNLDGVEGSLVLAGNQGRMVITPTDATISVINNWATGIRLGSNLVTNIRNSVGGIVNVTTYRHAVYSGNTFDKEANHFAGTRLSVASNTFTRTGNQGGADRMGWAVGAGATIIGNTTYTQGFFWSGMLFGQTAHSANQAITVQA